MDCLVCNSMVAKQHDDNYRRVADGIQWKWLMKIWGKGSRRLGAISESWQGDLPRKL